MALVNIGHDYLICIDSIIILLPRGLLFKQILPGLEPLLNSLDEIAKKRRKSMAQVNIFPLVRNFWYMFPKATWIKDLIIWWQVAINWCICKGTIPIPGVKSIKQAQENLGALGWRLNSDEMLQLDLAAQESPRRMIQNIFQTKWVSSQSSSSFTTNT